MKNGVVLMYMKEGVLYPVAMTEEEMEKLQFLARMFQPLKVAINEPQGQAVNLVK